MTFTMERISALVTGIYDSELDPARWQPTLKTLVDAFGARGGALMIAQPGERRFLSATIGLDHAAVQSYDAHYGQFDPVARVLERAKAGEVLAVRHVIAAQDHRHSEFYNDWAMPLDAGDGVFTRLLDQDDRISWLNLVAPLRPADFGTPTRIRLLKLLVPHLQRALRAQALLADMAGERDYALGALDHLPNGIMLIDARLRIQFANVAAHALCGRRDGLRAGPNGILMADHAKEHSALQGLAIQACSANPDAYGGGTLAVGRPTGKRPYIVHVVPLDRERDRFRTREPAALIIIVDPEREPLGVAPLLRDTFHLTRSESAVAVQIMRCEGLQAVADQLNVSLSTVRIHLQRVFEKTGTRRQAELVKLLVRLERSVALPEKW